MYVLNLQNVRGFQFYKKNISKVLENDFSLKLILKTYNS